MKLQRKLFVKPDYYEGLNEAEAEWLKNKRKEIARNTLKKRKDLINQNKWDDLKKLRNKVKGREEINAAEAGIRGKYKGKGAYKYIKDAVNIAADKKKAEEILRSKKTAELISKLKTGGKIGLGVLGAGALTGVGVHAVKKAKEKSEVKKAKKSILEE